MLSLNYPPSEIFVLNSSEHCQWLINKSNRPKDFVFRFGNGINDDLGTVSCTGGANSLIDLIRLDRGIQMFLATKALPVEDYLALKLTREIFESEVIKEGAEIKSYPKKERFEIEEIFHSQDFEFSIKQDSNKITSNEKVSLKTILTKQLASNLYIIPKPIRVGHIIFVSFINAIELPIVLLIIFKKVCSPLQFLLSIDFKNDIVSFLIGINKTSLEKKFQIDNGIKTSALGIGIILSEYGIRTEPNIAKLLDFKKD